MSKRRPDRQPSELRKRRALKGKGRSSTLSRTGPLFTSFESAKRTDQVHTVKISSALLAGMSPLSKGGGGTSSSDIQGSETRGEAPGPIGSEFQFSTPVFRGGGSHRWEERQSHATGPVSSKKRKANAGSALGDHENVFLRAIESAIAKALQAPTRPDAVAGCSEDVQSLRAEMEEIKKGQLQLTQLMNTVMAVLRTTRQETKGIPTPPENSAFLRGTAQTPNRQTRPHSAQVMQPSWANITESGAGTGWTTVINSKKQLKKHPRGQRRVLFVRNVRSHNCDPRDIMFDVNKALAHARAHVTVRLIKMAYTDKGNLTGVISENACADELLNYAPVVMAAVKKLDPEVAYMEKTERWLKLRVHGVALDRYMTEGGLDVAREEIELMTGEQLPDAPRWIKEDTLAERFDSGSIKRSTLVLTVKNKKAADVILAKGLSFGGRRHEVERFWERGQGGMCMRCCGRDHFGQCTEEVKCFVCAGEHEGSKHECTAESCSKRSGPCEHRAAKCANCGGPHPATSRRCPERRSSRPTRERKVTEVRSSPPAMETAPEQDDCPIQGDQAEMEVTPTMTQTKPPQHIWSRYLRTIAHQSHCAGINRRPDQQGNSGQGPNSSRGRPRSSAPATRRTCPLTMIVIQHNCNGTAVSTIAALEAAVERGAEVACLQEPYVGKKYVIGHPGFQIRWPECAKRETRVALAIRHDALDCYVFEE